MYTLECVVQMFKEKKKIVHTQKCMYMVADLWPFIHQKDEEKRRISTKIIVIILRDKWWKKKLNRMASSLLLLFRYIYFCAYEKLARCVHRSRHILCNILVYTDKEAKDSFCLSQCRPLYTYNLLGSMTVFGQYYMYSVCGLFVLQNDIKPLNCILPMHTTILTYYKAD